MVRPLFLLLEFFCLVAILGKGSGVWYSGILWIGRARHPGPSSTSSHLGIEVLNVGGWLTHGDLALDTSVDFLAVVEHRLIPAGVRSEWSRLKKKDLASIWSPASQASSHVGSVGVICLRSAPLSLPTFATAQFKRFFDCGRAVRCMVPLGLGRFMHLVVLYGFQGADSDAEQLSLTEQLFDAALGELSVVSRGQPCLLVGDFNVEPTKIPCLAKGISAGLWVDLEEAWALAAGLRPAVTCKKALDSVGGHRRDFMVGCPFAVAAILSCRVLNDRWMAPHLAVRTFFHCGRWTCSVTQVVQRTPFGLLLGCLLLIKAEVLSLLRFGGFGTFMMSVFSLCFVVMPYCWMTPSLMVMFLGLGLFGLVLLSLHLLMLIGSVVVLFLVRGLVLGRGRASFRVVKLGGHKVRKARGYAADAHDAADVFLYRDLFYCSPP